MKMTAVIQTRKLLAATLVMALLAVAAACGGKAATPTPAVSPIATVAPVPTSASVPIASPAPVEPPSGVTQTSQTPTPSLDEVMEEADRMLEGGSLRSPDFIESPLGDLELPELDVAIPAGAVSGLDADFDWEFDVPEVDIEPPAISPRDLTP